MEDAELEVLQLAHRASGRALKGRAITPPEEAALHAVAGVIMPVLSPVEKSRTRSMLREITEIRKPPATWWTPATSVTRRLGGRWFR